MTMNKKEKLDTSFDTVDLKRRLYEIRDEALLHLVFNEPDQKITDLLKTADTKIQYWVHTNLEYLKTDDEYYSSVAHRILEPVYTVLNSREGLYEELENERDALQQERDLLAAELQQIKKDIRNYYGG